MDVLQSVRSLNALRSYKMDKQTRELVINLEALKYYTERLLREFATIEMLEPNVIERLTRNGEPIPVDPETRTADIEVPTRVAQLEDAGTYVHVRALYLELLNYVKKGELPENILTQEEKDRLDLLPDLTAQVPDNGVNLSDDRTHLEARSLTPDRLISEGYTLVLDCGKPEPNPPSRDTEGGDGP